MANQPASLMVRTPIVRMFFPALVETKTFDDGKRRGEPEYGVNMGFTPDMMDQFEVRREGGWEKADIRSLCAEVAKAEFPDINVKEAVQHGGLNWPVKDGESEADKALKKNQNGQGKKREEFRGYKLLRAKSKKDYPPQLFVVNRGEFQELDRTSDADMKQAEKLFVGGFYAKFSINLKATESPQGRFIPAYLTGALFVREGERIGGMSAEERFGGIEGGITDIDPTAGMGSGPAAGGVPGADVPPDTGDGAFNADDIPF